MAGGEPGLSEAEGDQVGGQEGEGVRGQRGEVGVAQAELAEAGEEGQQPGKAGHWLGAHARLRQVQTLERREPGPGQELHRACLRRRMCQNVIS